MATVLYPSRWEAPVLPEAFRGAWDQTSTCKDVTISTSKLSGSLNFGPDRSSGTSNWDICLFRAITAPLDGDQTISGTIDLVLRVQEILATHNVAYHLHVYVMKSDGTVRGTLLSDYREASGGADEWPTTAEGRALASAQSLSSVDAISGDRIVLEVGCIHESTVGSGSQTTVIGIGGTGGTDLTDGDTDSTHPGSITFSQTLNFAAETAPTSRWYFQNAAAGYTPTTLQGAWDDPTGATTKKLDKSKSGANTSVGVAETSASTNFDVATMVLVSDPLAGQTLPAGWVGLVMAASESSSSMNAVTHLHIWVSQGDSDTPRFTVLADAVEPFTGIDQLTEWGLAQTGRSLLQKLPTTGGSISAGDRLIAEIGYRAVNTSSTSFTGATRYGGTDANLLHDGDAAADADDRVGHLDFGVPIYLATEVFGARGQAVLVA